MNTRVRKSLCALTAILLLFTMLIGCSAGGKTGDTAQKAPEQKAGKALDEIRVALVLNYSSEDGGWSQSFYEAMMRTKAKLGLTDEQVLIMENVDEYSSDAESVIDMLASDGVDLIIASSPGYDEAIATVAAKYPDVKFGMYEGTGGGAKNVAAYDIADYEAMFLCGYALTRMSPINELGFIACQPQTSCVRMLNAFASGARYANADATVKVLWADSWYDPAKEKEAANTLISEGITSIGFFGGTTAVASACGEQSGIYTNGVYIDMDALAKNAMICSVLYTWDPVYESLIHMVVNDNWSNEALYPGIAEGGCALTDLNADIIPADILADCNDVMQKLMHNEIAVFAAPVYDNNGKCVLEEGKTFTPDDYITMLFLLDNVIGDLS